MCAYKFLVNQNSVLIIALLFKWLPPLFAFFIVKIQRKFKNRPGLFSIDAIYSRHSGQGPHWLIFDF